MGSLDVVTDGSGAIVDRASFDAWGKRRKFDWTVYTASMPFPWQGQTLTRGYTFHEQLDPVGLIHMNGRVYDPELGRFMSPDIAIQDISNLQSFNAYSYVQSNPLSFTDPSGYFLGGLFKAIGNFFKSIFKAIGQIFKAILNSQIGRALFQIAACTLGGAVGCLAAAGGAALAAGGSIVDAIKAIGFAFLSMNVWTEVGNFLHPIVNAAGVAGQAVSTVTHAVVGGALSVAQGGSFVEGFASAGLGSVGGFAGGDLVGNNPDGLFVRTAFAATAGGLASELTGGKFADGAITASFAHLFNDEANKGGTRKEEILEGGGGAEGGSGGVAEDPGNIVVPVMRGIYQVGEAIGQAVEDALGIGQGPRFARGTLRQQVLDKGRLDDGTVICAYCGEPTATQSDHVVPYSKGGPTALDNLEPACAPCNASKGAKDLGTEWIPPKDQ